MRRVGAGLSAVLMALAGCKGTGTDPKPPDKKDPAALAASRTKPKGHGPAWLDESLAKLPGAGTGVPKADSWVRPTDPGFDVGTETRGLLAGKVLDPEGRGAKGVFIRIEPADAQPRDKDGAPKGILTDSAGYFMAKGLPPGRAYNLIAEAKIDGKPLSGTVQTRPPQPNITISLRDDLVLPPSQGGTDTLPPSLPSTALPPPTGLPPPSSDLIPPAGMPKPAPTRPADGNWGPDPGAATTPVPATIPAATPPGPGGVPSTAAPLPGASPVRPESTAGGPPPWKPPAASLPGLPVPTLPPSSTPSPGGRQSSRPVRPGANFTLVDTLDRPWDFATSRSGPLVLLDFMTTTCVPCRQVIPILADIQGRYAADGLQLIGVVCDDAGAKDRVELAARYQREQNLNYEVYAEPGPTPGAVQERFHVPSYPYVVLLNGEGTVLWRGHPGLPDSKGALESVIRQALGQSRADSSGNSR